MFVELGLSHERMDSVNDIGIQGCEENACSRMKGSLVKSK
jgi:hypothetical protein